MRIIVMGVSGCGKTTLAEALARQFSLPFIDGDDLHPKRNIRKMKNGQPLNDRDRRPWLHRCRRRLQSWKNGGILACSALKADYRDILNRAGDVRFVYLQGNREVLLSRLQGRKGHFMPADLLDSQLAALEEPVEAVAVPVELNTEAQVELVLKALNPHNSGKEQP